METAKYAAPGQEFLKELARQCACLLINEEDIDFPLEPEIVQGGYASVHKNCTVDRSELVVVKSFLQHDSAISSTAPEKKRSKRKQYQNCAKEMVMTRLASEASPKFVVPCLRYGVYKLADVPFLVMPQRGCTLWKYLQEPPVGLLTPAIRLELAQSLLLAVVQLHASKIAHGDLKGNNVLVEIQQFPKSGSVNNVRIVDFGIANILQTPCQNATMAWTSAKGHYSPEWVHGEPTREADVWAICGLLYYILTCKSAGGKPPSWTAMRTCSLEKVSNCYCSSLILRLVLEGFAAAPKDRPTAEYLYRRFQTAEVARERIVWALKRGP